jgi:hypothetical protein
MAVRRSRRRRSSLRADLDRLAAGQLEGFDRGADRTDRGADLLAALASLDVGAEAQADLGLQHRFLPARHVDLGAGGRQGGVGQEADQGPVGPQLPGRRGGTEAGLPAEALRARVEELAAPGFLRLQAIADRRFE